MSRMIAAIVLALALASFVTGRTADAYAGAASAGIIDAAWSGEQWAAPEAEERSETGDVLGQRTVSQRAFSGGVVPLHHPRGVIAAERNCHAEPRRLGGTSDTPWMQVPGP